MASKNRERQIYIRMYKEETGETAIDMHKVAKFAVSKGWKLPKPADLLDVLAKQFSQAAREEIRRDSITGRPYRANHALKSKQMTLWIDIDEAPRKWMLKSLINRRDQMVGDGLQLSFDTEHWNNINPDKEPIMIPMDFTDDIEWRKNAPSDNEKKTA